MPQPLGGLFQALPAGPSPLCEGAPPDAMHAWLKAPRLEGQLLPPFALAEICDCHLIISVCRYRDWL